MLGYQRQQGFYICLRRLPLTAVLVEQSRIAQDQPQAKRMGHLLGEGEELLSQHAGRLYIVSPLEDGH